VRVTEACGWGPIRKHQRPERAVCDHSVGCVVGVGMSQDDDPMLKPDGHRYDAPESRRTTLDKEIVYAVLGIVVVGLALLIATGTVPIFPRG
jgi:hypothetical protein